MLLLFQTSQFVADILKFRLIYFQTTHCTVKFCFLVMWTRKLTKIMVAMYITYCFNAWISIWHAQISIPLEENENLVVSCIDQHR